MQQRAHALACVGRDVATLAEHRQDILAGLTATQKRLAPKYLYDTRGSELFDEICTLPEYYATRTEMALLRDHGRAIAALMGPGADIVELGAGSSVKACLLLDFTRPLDLPRDLSPEQTLVFFPGSTIGNLSSSHATALLRSLAESLQGASLLIGVDICKDAAVLHHAYNDTRGVTAAFNLNLLARLNRELEANFDLDAFEHDAVYESQNSRIEMRLVSRREQAVSVGGVAVLFRKGEYIISEHSHKYSPDEFASLAHMAGWHLERRWVDDGARFSVQYFRAR
jgi:uncharacterized SAM-dependent methyltransferase